ncbi:hypothetical protein WR25_14230 [Diploscapter pachys]|uniref:Uncharacterized protein n=1 Tax=Diploscapter pachys TaxID=2018661 RepID=A0A2A2KJE3_9BILA|nr:hypothetical protein WR25_14230 [Diploscapter pachys]
MRLDMRVEPPGGGDGGLGLPMADVPGRVDRLALQVGQIDRIVVDDRQRADPGGGEILDRGRADPSRADHQHVRLFPALLTRAPHVLQDDVAGVAGELVRYQLPGSTVPTGVPLRIMLDTRPAEYCSTDGQPMARGTMRRGWDAAENKTARSTLSVQPAAVWIAAVHRPACTSLRTNADRVMPSSTARAKGSGRKVLQSCGGIGAGDATASCAARNHAIIICRALDGGGHDLSDPVAACDRERRVAQIDQDHLPLAAIIAVDRPRRVEAGDAVFQGKPRARTHLDLEAIGNGEGEAGCDRRPRARRQGQCLGRDDVHARGAISGISGQGQAFAMGAPARGLSNVVRSAVVDDGQLVARRIAQIGRIPMGTVMLAMTGRALILRAMRHCRGVKGVDLVARLGAERHHRAVARGCRRSVERLADPERQAVAAATRGIAAPIGKAGMRRPADRRQHGIVESMRHVGIGGAQRHVRIHASSPLVSGGEAIKRIGTYQERISASAMRRPPCDRAWRGRGRSPVRSLPRIRRRDGGGSALAPPWRGYRRSRSG